MHVYKLIFIGLALAMLASCGGRPTKPDGTPMSDREILVDKQFSGWDGSHPALTERIKASMNDPDSYEHLETMFKDEGDAVLVVTKFAGRNGFGGRVVQSITARVDLNGNVVEVVKAE